MFDFEKESFLLWAEDSRRLRRLAAAKKEVCAKLSEVGVSGTSARYRLVPNHACFPTLGASFP